MVEVGVGEFEFGAEAVDFGEFGGKWGRGLEE